MTRDNILNIFTKATKENFPVDKCTIVSGNDKNVYDSDKLYWIFWYDQRFHNELTISLATPYIWLDENKDKFYGWIAQSGNTPIDNLENSVNGLNWDDVVIAFSEYESE